MGKYVVVADPAVDTHIIKHVEFLSRVSLSAAKKFRNELREIMHRLSENPYQFPVYDDPNLPVGLYRKANFATWYKAVFSVEEKTVYIDTVLDGRMNNGTL